MYHSLRSCQIAVVVAVALISTGMLPSALADGGERTAKRKSIQPAWYRLWNDLSGNKEPMRTQGAAQPTKSANEKEYASNDSSGRIAAEQVDEPTATKTFKAEPLGKGVRWFKVTDTDSSDSRSRESGRVNLKEFHRFADFINVASVRTPNQLVESKPELKSVGQERQREAQPTARLQENRRPKELTFATRQASLTEMQPKELAEIKTPQLLLSANSSEEKSMALVETHSIRSSKPVSRTVNIQLDAATLHRLHVHDPIDHVEVGNRQVCEAFREADRELKLIAKRNGETKVAIHYATARGPEVYIVRVGAYGKQQKEVTGDLQLEKMIAEMYPESNVMLTPKNQTLVITGTTHSNAEAVRILSLVRSLRLVPVVDQLQVQ